MEFINLFSLILALAGILLQGFFITAEHKSKFVSATVLKGLASFCFVCIGYIAAIQIQSEISFANKIVLGLLFGLLGDVCLELRFVLEKIGPKIFLLGIAMFLAGHILYLVALIPYASNLWLCVIIGTLISGSLLAYIFLTMKVKPAFKIFGVFYLGAVIIMTVISISIGICSPSIKNTVYAAGAVLFTISDIVLIFNTFSGVTRFPLRVTNLSLYYVGQLLIAGSLFFI